MYTKPLIYNGRIAKARKLAAWWDRHKESDNRHEANTRYVAGI